jgi:hypothetical protein
MGTLETATGVAKRATRAANLAPPKASRKHRNATPSPSKGTSTVRMTVPKRISRLSSFTAENSN